MKTKFKLIGAASAASLCALAVMAQNIYPPSPSSSTTTTSTGGTNSPNPKDIQFHSLSTAEYGSNNLSSQGSQASQSGQSSQQSAISVRAEQTGPATRASDLVGTAVRNHQNEKLGKIDHLDLDLSSGRITQVIIATGGFAGMGSSLHAFQPQALQYNSSDKVVYLEATSEQIKSMPEWKESSQSSESGGQTSTRESGQDNAYTYESHPADGTIPARVIPSDKDNTRSVQTSDGRWVTRQGGNDSQMNNNTSARYHSRSRAGLSSDENTSVRAGMESSDSTRSSGMGTAQPTLGNASSSDVGVGASSTTASDSKYRSGGSANSSAGAGLSQDTSGSSSDLSAGTSTSGELAHNSTKLIGKPVRNMQDERLGKVEDFIVDLQAGRIVAVVVSSGGFLGMNNELSAVPPTAFHYSSQQNVLQLDVTKETLASATHFPADQWPDLSQPNAIRVDAFNTGSSSQGSAQNVREQGRHSWQTNSASSQQNSGSTNNSQQQYQQPQQ